MCDCHSHEVESYVFRRGRWKQREVELDKTRLGTSGPQKIANLSFSNSQFCHTTVTSSMHVTRSQVLLVLVVGCQFDVNSVLSANTYYDHAHIRFDWLKCTFMKAPVDE